MKHYLLFAGANYYPNGGAHDFAGAYDTEAEAREAFPAAARTWARDWAHVAFLTEDGRVSIVAEYTEHLGWHLP